MLRTAVVWRVAATFWTVICLAGAARPLRAEPWPCDVRTADRIVAIGDVHGAYDQFTALLRVARLVDERERWIGGRATLIQTGDVLDRGPDSRRVVDLLRKLEREAPRRRGRVIALLGNHELMRLIGDWRYVSRGEYEAYRTSASGDVRDRTLDRLVSHGAARAKHERTVFDAAAFREQFERDTPLGALEMRLAFDARGDHGQWVRTRPTVGRVNGLVFVHGGVSESIASLGCEGINDIVRKEIASLPWPPEQVTSLTATSETGPLWYRGLVLEPEARLAQTIDGILDRMRARAIIVGHTALLPGRIATRLGGRVVQIDSGMLGGLFFPGGVPSALEVAGDQWTAIYVDRREPVPAPALQPSGVAVR